MSIRKTRRRSEDRRLRNGESRGEDDDVNDEDNDDDDVDSNSIAPPATTRAERLIQSDALMESTVALRWEFSQSTSCNSETSSCDSGSQAGSIGNL